MRKYHQALILFFIMIVAVRLSAQDSTGFVGFDTPKKIALRQNVIKSNVLPLLSGQIPYCGELRITYERMTAHNQSLTIGFSYNYTSPLLAAAKSIASNVPNYVANGARMTLGYRFYPLKRKTAPGGFFVGPFLSYNFAKVKEKHGNGSYAIVNYPNANVIVGYQILTGKGFCIEFFGGIGYRKNFIINYDSRHNKTSIEDEQSLLPPPFTNVKIVSQINFGYAF